MVLHILLVIRKRPGHAEMKHEPRSAIEAREEMFAVSQRRHESVMDKRTSKCPRGNPRKDSGCRYIDARDALS